MRKAVIVCLLLLLLSTSAAGSATIKVLILDDVFRNVPAPHEKMLRVGRIRGDLLVNGTRYPGNVQVWKDDAGMYLINELPLEEYVKSVVSAEVGQDWDMEALKVQAVIARTYALRQKKESRSKDYDLTSSVLHQVYKGSTDDERIAAAVRDTAGEVLTYQGRLIEAFYHSTCGGKTEDPEEVFGRKYPYLRPVSSDCDLSPYRAWQRRIPSKEVAAALDLRGVRKISVKSHTTTGRVRELRVVSKGRSIIIKATELRRLLGWRSLPSTDFTVGRDGDDFVFEGKGYGHGVGLCQWGALEMAKKGKNYREILAFYYPGTVIKSYEDR